MERRTSPKYEGGAITVNERGVGGLWLSGRVREEA